MIMFKEKNSETSYIENNPAMVKRLSESIEQVNNGQVVETTITELKNHERDD